MRARVVAIAVVAYAIAAIALAQPASAAPRVVRGVVTAQETGRVVVGATVLKDRGDVAITDADGYFSVTLADPSGVGTRVVCVASPGAVTVSSRPFDVDGSASVIEK